MKTWPCGESPSPPSKALFPAVIRILLIDDHALVRTGLGLQLEKIHGIQIIGEAATGWQGIKLVRDLQPNLVILDLNLPDISGLEVVQRLLKIKPVPKILMISSDNQDWMPAWLQAAGAHGYISKIATIDELKNVIETVFEKSADDFKTQLPQNSFFNGLTHREVEVMRMITRGDAVTTIAKQLHLNIKTIYAYRSDIFQKLQLKNDVALALFAMRYGLIAPEETPYLLKS
jgi:two-component system invasion response regulator UvrY